LGLAIVKKLARAMGGEAGVVSKPGFGASFWVELPLPTAEDLSNAAPSLQGVRVAVMAESPVLTQALRAATVSLAAELVDDNADVLLCDWREDLDVEAIADLKGKARALIMLIPQERRDAIVACRAAGAEHYTLKPVRRRSLAERIRVALGDAPAGAATDVFETEAPRLLAGLKVLVAEDNPINALLARTLLTRAGCAVTLVHDGAEAVIAASAAPFDLVFLDIRMPRVDGLEAAARIRAGGGPSARAPIVALTADAGEHERSLALQAGMNDFITKPIDASRLLAVAERFTPGPKPATFADDDGARRLE
jgi:CheY-like chemotaxis protein